MFLAFPVFGQQVSQKEIAITIDDLPATNSNQLHAQEILEINQKLVAVLREQRAPVVGFVNEEKLYKWGEVDTRIQALSQWVEAGIELGNHTYSHVSLDQIELKDWEEEVVRGESVTKMLDTQHQMNLRYFRYPFLDAGRDLKTRRDAEAFLSGRGFTIAPVTIDASDWLFGEIYENARRRGDAELQRRLIASYLDYTSRIFDYYEKLSRDLVGYEPRQILLIHANWMEAEHLSELLDLLRKRGYRFVSLAKALDDPAYSIPDEYVGPKGQNYFSELALMRGKPELVKNAPTVPQWIIEQRSQAGR
jgi:peptidoglycan/xylan/chitin deacetylase (PgdA/CDA1 family)